MTDAEMARLEALIGQARRARADYAARIIAFQKERLAALLDGRPAYAVRYIESQLIEAQDYHRIEVDRERAAMSRLRTTKPKLPMLPPPGLPTIDLVGEL